jgi:ammonium transporter, Amt family
MSLILPCFLLSLLAPLALAGLALINAGLGRSRSAAHAMLASLCAAGVAALAYFVCGFAWQSFAGGPAHTFFLAGRQWSWLGAGPFFLSGVANAAQPGPMAAWLGMLAACLAAMIPLGAGADRWRLSGVCASTALFAGITYPVFAHWAWGGGWLAQLGFIDAGGSGTIQAAGGLTALAIVWILGPRRGKYNADGMPAAIPGHNAVLVLAGCFLALLGWLGLNSAGALLFAGLDPARLIGVAINTALAAAAAALAAALVTGSRFGKPDASLCANGWIGGLAASSAGCAVMAPAAAVAVGASTGLLITFAIEWLELKLGVDDPGGSVAVHGMGGILGVLAAGLFAPNPGQFVTQLVGVTTVVGFVLPLSYGLNRLLDRLSPLRVAVEGERQGLDLYELGAGAYPEFLTRTEDFYQR